MDKNEVVTKALYSLAGASVGGLIMGVWKNYQIKNLCEQINANTIDRLKTMSGLFNKVTEIMQDPMTSGDEKEALMEEQMTFVQIIVEQPII